MATSDLLKWQYILLIFSSSLQVPCSGGELRFCYHGPQRVQYKDCPGGFIAKKTLNASCLYYYKADGVPNMAAQFSDNICEAGHQKELDRDFQEFTETDFQFIQFTDVDVDGNETSGAESAPDKCNETCLAEWVDLKHWNPVPIFVDKPEANESEAETLGKEYVELTKIIMIRIINEDEYEDEDEEGGGDGGSGNAGNSSSSSSSKLDILHSNTTNFPMPSIMKILAKSMRIIFGKCEPYIETSFYNLVFRTMQEFQKMNSNFPSINVLPFKRIMNLLERCEMEANQTFQLNGTNCDERHIVQQIVNLKKNETHKYKLHPNSFRWGRYDPIIEAAWTAVDFVHAFCFDIFAEDMLHYSHYVRAMIEVFVQPVVQKHWMANAPVGKGMTLWEMAYDTPDIQNQMRSLDACVNAAYENSLYDRRLERPFTTEEAMSEPQFIDDPDIPEPGWNKTIEEYWKMYEKKGFKEIIHELGYCLQTPQEFNSTHDDLVAETCETHLD